MLLTSGQADLVLSEARKLIGKSYADLDCSHFVNEAYAKAKLAYEYAATAVFVRNQAGPDGPFQAVAAGGPQPADVLLFPSHMGLWDPQGCQLLGTNAECKRLNNKAPFLSSRSTDNRGPDFGVPSWFGSYKLYRWKGATRTVVKDLKVGQVIHPLKTVSPTAVLHWKYARECSTIHGGMTDAADLRIVEVSGTPGAAWVRVQIPGAHPPAFLKIAGEEYAANFRLVR